MSGDEDAHFGLVMPFVVCESNGGPYEDVAFVAGARFGEIMSRLAHHRLLFPGNDFEPEFPVEPALIPQLDLLAMHEGYTLSTEPWEDGTEWAFVRFFPLSGDDDPEADR